MLIYTYVPYTLSLLENNKWKNNPDFSHLHGVMSIYRDV